MNQNQVDQNSDSDSDMVELDDAALDMASGGAAKVSGQAVICSPDGDCTL